MMTKKGFTLIELLVVVAIIGVLASIVLASLGSAKKNALDAKTVLEVRSLKTALELYYQDHGSYPLIPIADPTAWDMVAFCSDGVTADASTAAVPALMLELSPYLGSALEIDKCIWYTAYDSTHYITPAICNIDHYADGQGYLMLYNLPTKKIEPDYYTSYPSNYGLYAGNFHCTTYVNP